MELVKTRAIVARRTEYAETNCMLTLVAENLGVISACVYGIKSKKSRLRAVSQPLCYAEFVLERGKGDIFRVTSAEIIETFYPLSEDVEKLALANYFMELLGDNFSDADTELLTLTLNALYALAYKGPGNAKAKAAYELKLMQYAGYEPSLDSCIKCGSTDNLKNFDFSGGAVCTACSVHSMPTLTKDVMDAMNYILKSDSKRLFSFILPETAQDSLSKIAEGYILSKSEKHYKSLEYYKKLKKE